MPNRTESRRPATESEPLEVAIAIIERNGTYLITQRLPDDSFGGFWEFPGGKLQPGETLEACLVREIQEELKIIIEVQSKLQIVEHRYPNRLIRLHCFISRVVAGDPQAIECTEWRWVPAAELSQFRFPPASESIIRKLQEQAAQ